jgi:hypothetical protein
MARGGAKQRNAGRTPGFLLLGLLLALGLTGAFARPAVAAEAPYEPNDSIPAAQGPLSVGQQLFATLESASDRDFYFFYVTAPAGAAVELTVQNLGGGKSSDLDATILDSAATPVVAQSFIRDGEARLLTAQLEPQKYLVEVTANEGFGDSYSLTGGGSAGAFGPYTQISGRCASANGAARKAGGGLGRAESRLQRTTARVRRSRFAPPKARRKARAAHQRAKRDLVTKQGELRTARQSMQPWCGIAP